MRQHQSTLDPAPSSCGDICRPVRGAGAEGRRRLQAWTRTGLKLHRAVPHAHGAAGHLDWSSAIIDAASLRAEGGALADALGRSLEDLLGPTSPVRALEPPVPNPPDGTTDTPAYPAMRAAYLRAVGRRVRGLRHQRDLSQTDLATAAGMRQGFLSKIERGVALTAVLGPILVDKDGPTWTHPPSVVHRVPVTRGDCPLSVKLVGRCGLDLRGRS